MIPFQMIFLAFFNYKYYYRYLSNILYLIKIFTIIHSYFMGRKFFRFLLHKFETQPRLIRMLSHCYVTKVRRFLMLYLSIHNK